MNGADQALIDVCRWAVWSGDDPDDVLAALDETREFVQELDEGDVQAIREEVAPVSSTSPLLR